MATEPGEAPHDLTPAERQRLERDGWHASPFGDGGMVRTMTPVHRARDEDEDAGDPWRFIK